LKFSKAVRKRWRLDTPMLVPAQWQGSVEHFYHFFFGYFMPITIWLEKNPCPRITVRDCGPMNPWFELLNKQTEISFIQPGVMLQRTLTNLQKNQVFWGWDDPSHFQSKNLKKFRDAHGKRLNLPVHTDSSETRNVTVLIRGESSSFFESQSEVLGSGSAARSIGNLGQIDTHLNGYTSLLIIDTAVMTPEDQIRAIWDTDILVAQHGAGLSNMVWMRPGATVVEIQPPLAPVIDTIFSNLAAACGLKHSVIPQKDAHADVDVATLSEHVKNLMVHDIAVVPQIQGTRLFQFIRALPRGW